MALTILPRTFMGTHGSNYRWPSIGNPCIRSQLTGRSRSDPGGAQPTSLGNAFYLQFLARASDSQTHILEREKTMHKRGVW